MEEEEIKRSLDHIGVSILEPHTKAEKSFADALDAFSSYVLYDEPKICQKIVEHHLTKGSAGLLQGGTSEYDIYRLKIEEEKDRTAASELLLNFHSSTKKRYETVLTIEKLKQYMLGMCTRHSNIKHYGCNMYAKLGNLMFILAFGPTSGQIRHIDKMEPNVQICLYMSRNCPTTEIYDLDEPTITNAEELCERWEVMNNENVPEALKALLLECGDWKLGDRRQTRYFGFLNTINESIKTFGKLYRPLASRLALKSVDPGTTLVSPGNEVHAGPKTSGPRMFAFAIGIPSNDQNEDFLYNEDADTNDGEVQYHPVLFHVDLCTILFAIVDNFEFHLDHDQEKQMQDDVKIFLIRLFIHLIGDSPGPGDMYDNLITDERKEVKEWVGKLVQALWEGNEWKIQPLIVEAISSNSIFYSPTGGTNLKERRQRRRRAKKKKVGME